MKKNPFKKNNKALLRSRYLDCDEKKHNEICSKMTDEDFHASHISYHQVDTLAIMCETIFFSMRAARTSSVVFCTGTSLFFLERSARTVQRATDCRALQQIEKKDCAFDTGFQGMETSTCR